MTRRLGLLGTVIGLLFALLVGQSIYVQFFHAGALNSSSLNPRVSFAGLMQPRGDIVAADGTVLATSVSATSGVYPWRRSYPLGSLTSGVVGFSSSIYGTWALESYYNSELTSHPQPAQSISQVIAPISSPNTLTLTIQPELQRVAQVALRGRDGAVVAINPKTGAVLAMYSNPNYDPSPITSPDATVATAAWKRYVTKNERGFPPLGLMATQQTFAPGSTFKVITSAAAAAARPDIFVKKYPSKAFTTLPTSDKLLWNSGHTPCGGNAADMLPGSCDPGFALIGLDLGAEVMSATATAFGFNQVPPIDLPGVVSSYFPDAASFSQDLPGLAYSAIGQKDVRATALENALLAAAIANHGVIMKPHLMAEISRSDGSVARRYKPSEWLRPLSALQAQQIVPMMQNVARFGTASGLFRASDQVGAKTGTAQTGNAAENTHDWMIAFAPANNPVIAVAVVVPFQAKSDSGAAVAGPIMRCIIEDGLALAKGRHTSGTTSSCR
jgi:penicillin-binding protein A